jgi:uncharacterized protein with FMN-binding domain
MRKALIVVIAIAVLGILGIYTDGKKTSGYSSKTDSSKSAAVVTPSSDLPSTGSPSPVQTSSGYKDGTYTGDSADTPYGSVQVAAVVSGGKIVDIKFLQMPYLEDHSREVTSYSKPHLKQSAISNQSASVDFISGATSTVYGFEQSLQAALDQATRA